jgi:hypothetical protein
MSWRCAPGCSILPDCPSQGPKHISLWNELKGGRHVSRHQTYINLLLTHLVASQIERGISRLHTYSNFLCIPFIFKLKDGRGCIFTVAFVSIKNINVYVFGSTPKKFVHKRRNLEVRKPNFTKLFWDYWIWINFSPLPSFLSQVIC